MNRDQFENRAYRVLYGNLALEIANISYILEGKMNILYVPFQTSIIAKNDAFLTLWNNKQKTEALSFVRIVSEHLVYLYAEYLHPNRVISGLYDKYKELDRIKANGEKIKPSEIREKLASDYKGFSEIWKEYHYFIHPSYMQGSGLDLAGANERGIADMIRLNNWILDVLTKIKGRYKQKLKKAGLYQKYLDYLEYSRREWEEDENSQSD